MNILTILNPQQSQAVEITDGPVLVLAGAGSGKTRTLTHRIAHLISLGVPRHCILAVTFTNKAANEMKERVQRLLLNSSCGPTIGTFHSICAKILREDAEHVGLTRHFTILDENDTLRLIKQVLKDLHLSAKEINPKIVRSTIERAKQEVIGPDQFSIQYEDLLQPPFDVIIPKVYQTYQEYLLVSNAVDFGDLMFHVVHLWKNRKGILQKYQNRFKYVLVDEFQDTNFVQHEFCRLLVQEHQNLFVVGDDYQSIYSFRGANIENILRFSENYPRACKVILEQNYRSTQSILNVANIIIQKNRYQEEKVLWTENEIGDKPQIVEVDDEIAEAEFVAETILVQRKDKSCSLNKFVVLYRTNAQSRAIEEVLLQYGMPYRIIGGIRFYERKEIKDIIAYLRVILNPHDIVSMERIINIPPRGIGKKTWNTLQKFLVSSSFTRQDIPYKVKEQLSAAVSQKLSPFFELLSELIKKSEHLLVTELIEEVFNRVRYKEYLKETEENFEERRLNVEELKTSALRFTAERGRVGLQSFLEEIALVADIDTMDTKQDALTLMTVHASKGLEFDCVFMVGMEQGLFPYGGIFYDPKELEEERRLCYVGVTRARKLLYFTHARSRTLYGNTIFPEISEFIEELGEEVVWRDAR